MKWIGQHIYDLISRFRNHAVFEYYSSNTGGNKYRTTTINGDTVALANSSTSSGPSLTLTSTFDHQNGPTIDYYNQRANPADHDKMLLSRYIANNDNGDAFIVGQQLWSFADVSDGAEKGKYGLSLAAHSSAGVYNFFEAEAKGSNDIDVKIALGSSSTTTIRGDLTVSGGDISLGGTGRIQGIDTVTDATDAASKAYVDTAISGTVGSAVDLTSEVSGILPVANGGTGASSLTDNKLLTGTGTSAVTAEANATYDGTDFTLLAASQYKPILKLHNQHNSEESPELLFLNQRSDDASVVGGNGDEAGKITFKSINGRQVVSGGPEDITYAQIKGSIKDATDGGEEGQLDVQISQAGSLVNVLKANSLGFGTNLEFADGSLLATVDFKATIVSFESSFTTGPIFSLKNMTDDATGPQLMFIKDRDGTPSTEDNDELGRLTFRGYDSAEGSTDYAEFYGQAVETDSSNEAGKAQLTVMSDGQSTQRNGITCTGHTTVDKVDIDLGYGTASTTTVAGNLNASGTDHTFTSATADKPVLSLINTNTASDSNASLKFIKDAANVIDGEFLGEIFFIGDNDAGTPEQIDYAKIWSRVADMTDGSEKGSLYLGVASYDGEMQLGVSIVSGNIEDEVDVTVGNGAASTTTVAGDLSITTGLILDSVDVTTIQTSAESFADNDTSLMTSAAIDDRINAAGGGADEVVSTGDHILKQTKVTIDTAGFNGLNSTPVELVAAQGANKVIVPTEVVLFHDRASNQTNSIDLIVGFNGLTSYPTAVKYIRRYMQNITTDRTMTMGDYARNYANDLTTAVNSNLTIATSGAPTTNCVTSLTVYTSYYVIDIS